MSLQVGDVLLFKTRRVIGRVERKKYHVCVCVNLSLFLFINSKSFDGSFKIDQSDFPQLPETESHISCNAVVKYESGVPKAAQKIGRLSDECLKRLMDHVDVSEVMPEEDMENVVAGLFNHFST